LANTFTLASEYGMSWRVLEHYISLLTFEVGAVLLMPLAYTVVCVPQHISRFLFLTSFEGVRYGITSEALIGACFLPNGLGNLSKFLDYLLYSAF
jgi:hypothetical protein